ncbi:MULTISPECIES: heme/hemin ABC transporter substrate-binding protein [Corallincola]|uniref:Hemin ABC transporter substrate-binding protein n=2 Tax=Corallincola TaxID=1775176 RepID=A0ABY1WLF5_9GAMM|nr:MULTISPECIES: ABC transporter substrate-binding protein [Corallincola]TAA41745.1 hemin ABC transporter substrate-binding protein [Corallincola spongiicola]TCI02266.1 hemin ABC transporter substrate-binding protein [Corallincola luteus]
MKTSLTPSVFASAGRALRTTICTVAVSATLLVASSANLYAAERLVSTDAGATDLIVAMGLADELVAIDVTSQPPQGKQLPSVGYHRALSAEGLLSLKPTTVVGSEHMGPPAAVQALESAKVQLVQLPSADTPTDLANNIQQLAAALNRPEQGEALLIQLNRQLGLLNEVDRSEQRVAFLLAMDPSKLRLAGAGTGGDAFIDLLGAQNVAEFDNYRNVSAESLLSMQPTVILVAGKVTDQAVTSLLTANPILQHTPAGSQQRIIAVDGSSLVAGLSMAAVAEAKRTSAQLEKTL